MLIRFFEFDSDSIPSCDCYLVHVPSRNVTTSRIYYEICNEAAADNGDAIDDDDGDAMMMMMMMMMQLYDNNTAIQLTILLSQTRKGAKSRPSAKIVLYYFGHQFSYH